MDSAETNAEGSAGGAGAAFAPGYSRRSRPRSPYRRPDEPPGGRARSQVGHGAGRDRRGGTAEDREPQRSVHLDVEHGHERAGQDRRE